MNIAFYLFLSALVTCSGSNLLAASGYFAASSPVRNYLLRSGFTDLISSSAKTMYESSGFRYISDRGSKIKKAKMRKHTINEMRKRKGQLEESERLFNVISEMDKNACVSRLLCEIGAQPHKFGVIGYKVNKYLRSIPPVIWNSWTFSYREAFLAGFYSGIEICFQHYSSCSYNLYRAVSFLRFIKHPVEV